MTTDVITTHYLDLEEMTAAPLFGLFCFSPVVDAVIADQAGICADLITAAFGLFFFFSSVAADAVMIVAD